MPLQIILHKTGRLRRVSHGLKGKQIAMDGIDTLFSKLGMHPFTKNAHGLPFIAVFIMKILQGLYEGLRFRSLDIAGNDVIGITGLKGETTFVRRMERIFKDPFFSMDKGENGIRRKTKIRFFLFSI